MERAVCDGGLEIDLSRAVERLGSVVKAKGEDQETGLFATAGKNFCLPARSDLHGGVAVDPQVVAGDVVAGVVHQSPGQASGPAQTFAVVAADRDAVTKEKNLIVDHALRPKLRCPAYRFCSGGARL
jgi:hypothetical protein